MEIKVNRIVQIFCNSTKSKIPNKNVCAIIKKYKRIAEKQSQTPIINELIALYRNKPAFLDELSRIK